MTVRRRVLVSGRVQGVFFRDSARREALREGLGGSARNLDDGRVEVILEGDEDAVDRVIAWCSAGPDHADVDSVDVTEEDPAGAAGFSTS
ncbi:MAG: acylphosphatase [Actinomycetota bacterium]|nr:acylphosphatase [Actinomycetota bacterium]